MDDIVIDVASKYWKGNPVHILNLLVHEIFNVGYSFYRTLQSEENLIDEGLYNILDNIVNEGICTYVGYCALPIFPAENERDYVMLDDPQEVRSQLAETNQVLSQFRKIPDEALSKISWNKGVIDRAYYVTGAYICQTIDHHAGRKALIDVYSKGPLSIIGMYNTLVGSDMAVFIPEEILQPDELLSKSVVMCTTRGL